MPPNADERDALADRARTYAAEARAPRTRAVYAGDFARFAEWCAEQTLAPLPAVARTVGLYLTALADEGLKPTTIARALVGIGHAHRNAGLAWDRGAAEIKDVLRGIRRRHGGPPEQKAPVLDHHLRALVATLSPDLVGTRDRAMLTLGWCGALRRSELVALDLGDIAFVNEGLVLTIRASKTDPLRRAEQLGIPHARDAAVCAVRAVRAWLDAAGLSAGPLFRAVYGDRVRPARLADSAVMRVVKRAAKAAGLEPAAFAGHSLRAGFATTAAAHGKSLEAIMRQTRHRSERVARGYIRHATVFVDHAGTGLL